MRKTTVKGYFYAVLSAVLFGCMPLMATGIYDQGVTPTALVFWRNLLALPGMAFLAYRERRTLKVPLQALPTMVLLSFFGCTITPILLFGSYRYIASGTATVFHFIYPAAVVVVGMVVLRKKVHGAELFSVGLCMVGVMLFYEPGATVNFAGSAMALGSGVLFSFYIVMLDVFRWREEVSGFLLSFYIAALSALMTGIISVVTGEFAMPATLTGWGLCLLFALLMLLGVAVMVICYLFKRPILYFFGASDVTYPYAVEYLDIYLSRVQMSEDAARFLGCTYEIIINGTRLNRQEA